MDIGFFKGKAYGFQNEISYSSGAVVSKIVLKNEAGNVTLFSFDKGQGLSEHTAPYDAIAQILDGKAQITIDNHPHILSEGESIIMPANVPHALKAIEPFKMQLIMIKGK